MANKANFHRIKIYNGYGSNEVILPANTHYDIKEELGSDTERVEFIESNIWKSVNILPESIGVAFFFTDDGLEFHQGNYGFDYLKAQFKKEYDSVIQATIPEDD